MPPLPTPQAPWIVAPLVARTAAELAALVGRLSGADDAAPPPPTPAGERLLAPPPGAPRPDALEWRLDGYGGPLREGFALVRLAGLPVLATWRTELVTAPPDREGAPASAGAPDPGPDPRAGDYTTTIRELLALRPDLLDVEAARPEAPALVAEARAAGIVPVVSAHLVAMPPDPAAALARLRALAGDGIAKLAVTVRTASDLQVLADAGTAATREGRCVVVGMGGPGVDTRLRPGRYGSCVTFASLGRASAPGQLPVEVVARALGRV